MTNYLQKAQSISFSYPSLGCSLMKRGKDASRRNGVLV